MPKIRRKIAENKLLETKYIKIRKLLLADKFHYKFVKIKLWKQQRDVRLQSKNIL